MIEETEDKFKSIVTVNVQIISHNNAPAIRIMKTICDMDKIKHILSCAYHDEPIIIVPQFANKLEAINSMIQKGIIYTDEDGTYKYVQ